MAFRDFPLVFDNTMLSDYRTCPKKFMWAYIRGIRPKVPAVDLHAGIAFAKGLEIARRSHFVEGLSPSRALEEGLLAAWRAYGTFEPPPQKEHKNRLQVGRALISYLNHYPMDTDYLKPTTIGPTNAIEFTFAVPVQLKHPQSGEDLIIAGRCDMIAKFRDSLYVVDEKTTSRLGRTWSEQWPLRSQFRTYVWAAREFGWPAVGAIVRGIALSKTEIRHAEAIIPIQDWMIHQWLETTYQTLKQIKESWTNNRWLPVLGDACNSYGGCRYRSLCLKRDPEPWIATNYEEWHWNPLRLSTSEEENNL